MRVTGRRGRTRRPSVDDEPATPRGPARPRADSAPVPKSLQPTALNPVYMSPVLTGHGMSVRDTGSPAVLEQALSGTSPENTDAIDASPEVIMGTPPPGETPEPLGAMLDEGSDVDDEDMEDADLDDVQREHRADIRASTIAPSRDVDDDTLVFTPISVPLTRRGSSALTAALNKHVPHLVSTSSMGSTPTPNPFATLYSSVASGNAPGLSLQVYFPHSSSPTTPITIKVRKEATVEEVTGHGLLKYWDEGCQPKLSEEESDQRRSTVGWGLRIVEDDGEVDEDFPREHEHRELC